MSKANEIATLFNDSLHKAVNDRIGERAKELISEQDPTIDWSKVRIVSNLQEEKFYMESDDPSTEEKIRIAYEKVKNS